MPNTAKSKLSRKSLTEVFSPSGAQELFLIQNSVDELYKHNRHSFVSTLTNEYIYNAYKVNCLLESTNTSGIIFISLEISSE